MSWANPIHKDYLANIDSLAVARLKAAGAIIIGKTNVPTMLKDWQTYNDLYGTTNNPWDHERTPGGSSGGSAAALAAGLVPLELGSDMAGSLRVPAHFCGVFAHKPSRDIIPMNGTTPPRVPNHLSTSMNDFAVIGPMARCADDLILAMDVLAGCNEQASKGYQLNLTPARHRHLKDYRVLILPEHPLCPVSNDTQHAIHQFVDKLERENVKIYQASDTTIPDLADTAQTFALLLTSISSNTIPTEIYETIQARVKELDDDDVSLQAQLQRGFVLSHRQWRDAHHHRHLLRCQWLKLFEQFDVILHPVMPTAAFQHNHIEQFDQRTLQFDDKIIPYAAPHAWNSLATLCDLPTTVMPIARNAENLPLGIQIIGNYLEDNTTLQFAKQVEEAIGGFIAPPTY